MIDFTIQGVIPEPIRTPVTELVETEPAIVAAKLWEPAEYMGGGTLDHHVALLSMWIETGPDEWADEARERIVTRLNEELPAGLVADWWNRSTLVVCQGAD